MESLPDHTTKHRRSSLRLALVVAAEVVAVAGLLLWYRVSSHHPLEHDVTRPVLMDLRLQAVIADDLSASVSRQVLEASILRHFSSSEGVEVPEALPTARPRDRTGYEISGQLVLGVRDVDEDGAMIHMDLALELRIVPPGGPPVSFDATDKCERFMRSVDAGALSRFVVSCFSEVYGQATLAATEASKPVDELVEDARAGSKGQRVAAIRALGERGEGLDVLVDALEDGDQDVVLAAVGALIQLEDPRAVGPLIDSTRGRNLDYLSQVVFAISSIGGDEAEAYLDTLVVGHESAIIRAKAKEALADLRARAARAAR